MSNVFNAIKDLPRPRVPGNPATVPPPLLAPTGNAKVDAVGDIVNRTVAPFRSAPDPKQGVCGVIQHYVGGALGVLGAPFEMLDTGFAMLTAPLAALMPGFPAATLMMPHLGPPHAHLHPPSLIPPAPPIPLPSIGFVLLPGCVSVLHGGIPAARASDVGLAFTCGSLAPALDIFTGSSNTFIGGSRAARMFDITRHCNPISAMGGFAKALSGIGVVMGAVGAGAQASAGNPLGAAMAAAQAAADAAAMALKILLGKDPGIPPGYGAVVLGNPTVLIGGFPMPDLLELIGGLFKLVAKGLKKFRDIQRSSRFWQKLSNSARRRASNAMRRVGVPRSVRRQVARAICFATGHPVDVVTGNMFTADVDLELAGPLPLRFEREYHSSSTYDGPLGHGWHHSFDMALCEADGGVAIRLADGRGLAFHALRPGHSSFDRDERATLSRDRHGYTLRLADGLDYRFGPPVEGQPVPLQAIADVAGQQISLRWRAGRLLEIVDAGGRSFEVESDAQGRMVAIHGPAPEGAGRVTWVRYTYDPHGDLVDVRDALEQPTRYRYRDHLLVRETDRRGLSFYFEYDGVDSEARCVHTWGDGEIHDHRLAYDDEARTTTVTDSHGQPLVYLRGDNGLALARTDALGNTERWTYNEFHQVVVETDPLGLTTYYTYDDRGNRTRVIGPEGATLWLQFDGADRLVRAVDVMGAWWQWHHDPAGRMVQRDGPDGSVRFVWDRGLLTEMIDVAGERTALGYDAQQNLASIRTPDGGVARYEFDALGRPIAATDPLGKTQRRRLDRLGRVIELVDTDGGVRHIEYDPLGNATRVRDGEREVHFVYQGTSKLASRHERDDSIHLEYDREERLVAVIDEQGQVHRLELDAIGWVAAETGFTGVRRSFTRDARGRVTAIHRASGRVSEFKYDGLDRLIAATHSDGGVESFKYRPDGQLIEAHNEVASVLFERDVRGRVLRELQGEHWVETRYDRRGRRIGLESSLGAKQAIERDRYGDVVGLRLWTGETDGPAAWSAEISRDALGQELERALPGGVLSVWERDEIGRPVHHHVRRFDHGERREPSATLHDRRYSWDRMRLRDVVDAELGVTHFGHDPVGKLAWARSEQVGRSSLEVRVPDVLGNIYRREDHQDRRYGPGGRLDVVRGPDGSTRHDYDADGNLIAKRGPRGTWRYHWNDRGLLVKVERPDATVVEFTYDPLGRRISKTHAGKVTRWVWDGHVPLHEWVEAVQVAAAPADDEPPADEPSVDGEREADARAHPILGPPDSLITWVFDPESFVPAAKISGGRVLGILTDFLGVPVAMVDAEGERVWSASHDTHGNLTHLEGDPDACPLRFPGQYADAETGLHYNRYRYYDPEAGLYLSPDPLGLSGGMRPYAYCGDPLTFADPLGLAACGSGRAFHSWNEFQKATAGQFATRADAAAAYRQLYTSQNPWPHGHTPHATTLPVGTQFQMAMSPGQPSNRPGGWGTTDHVPDQNYVRQNLAVTEQFKPDLERVVTYEVTQPLPANVGPVGPQIDHATGAYLPGGGSQLQMTVPPADRMNYLKVVSENPI